MQKHEFQRRMQRNHSSLHGSILKHRLGKSCDSSEEEDSDDDNEDSAAKKTRSRFSRREQCFVRAVNAYNQRSFRSQYDSFRNVDTALLLRQNSAPVVRIAAAAAATTPTKRASPESGLKKPNIVTESKVIRQALRIRENCGSGGEEEEEPIYETPSVGKKEEVPDDDGELGN